MNINWYPGHMKKTKELLKEQLKLVDVVWELLDARIPRSSKNPDIDPIVHGKPKIVILNKKDLADPRVTEDWVRYFKEQGITAIPMNSIDSSSASQLLNESKNLLEEKLAARRAKGIRREVIRAMIVGIPNVGKSSMINKYAKKKSAKTGNKPGVTKGKQWVRIQKDLEMLDTPGILWPRLDDKKAALNLAFVGTIKDEIMDRETLGLRLVETLLRNYPKDLFDRYGLEDMDEETTALEVLDTIAKKRGCMFKGNEVDYLRVANVLLDEFRSGMIAKISLETPRDQSTWEK